MPNRNPTFDACAFSILERQANEAATGSNSRPLPTQAQAQAGNYKMGRVGLHGMEIRIENVRGSVRSGTDAGGKTWSNRMAAHYGYIAGTRGADGDAVDVFVGILPEARKAWVINQQDQRGGFDEHKVMLGFATEQQARDAYLGSYDRGWRGLHSVIPASISQLKWWLRHGDMARPISTDQLPHEGESVMDKVLWNSEAEPVSKPLSRVIYDLRRDDEYGLMLDSISVTELLSDPDIDGTMALDAMVVEVGMLQRKMEQLNAVMKAASSVVNPSTFTIADPVKMRGTMQIAVVFAMDDGQAVTVWFHNPDTTPGKLTPMDELVSWKWMLNKKDVTIVVAPERGRDLNAREVARRIMKLVEKNSEAFKRANAKAAESAAEGAALDQEIAALEVQVERLKDVVEAVRIAKEDGEIVELPKAVEQTPSERYAAELADVLRQSGFDAFTTRRADIAEANQLNANEEIALGQLVENIVGVEFMTLSRAQAKPRVEGLKAQARGEAPIPPEGLSEAQRSEWLAGWDEGKADDDMQVPHTEAQPVEVVGEANVVADEDMPVAEVAGDEFGVFPDTPDGHKTMRDTAFAAMMAMRNDPPIFSKALQADVSIVRESAKKIKSFSADPRKVKLVTALRQIIGDGKKVKTMPSYAGEPGVLAYHVLRAVVRLEGDALAVRTVVKERQDGSILWDHTVHSVDAVFDSTKGNGLTEVNPQPDTTYEPGAPADATQVAGARPVLPPQSDAILDDAGGFVNGALVFNLFIEGEAPEFVEDDTSECVENSDIQGEQNTAQPPEDVSVVGNPNGLTDAEMVVLITTKGWKPFARVRNAISFTDTGGYYNPKGDGITQDQFEKAQATLNAKGVYLKRNAITAAGMALVKSYMPELGDLGSEKRLESFRGKFANAAEPVVPAAPATEPATPREGAPTDDELLKAAMAGNEVQTVSVNMALPKEERDALPKGYLGGIALYTKDDLDRAIEAVSEAEEQADYSPFVAADVKLPTAVQLGLNTIGRLILMGEDPNETPGPGWSNGHIVDLVQRPKLIDDAIKKYFVDTTSQSIRHLSESKFDPIISAARSRTHEIAPLGFYVSKSRAANDVKKGTFAYQTVRTPAVVLGDESTGVATLVNRLYFGYFFRTYKGCTFHVGDPTQSIAVKHNGQLVGIIMPINGASAKMLKAARRAASPEAQEAASVDQTAVAVVDRAYRFEQATDRFKEYVAETVDEKDYSMFATAKSMDVAAKAHGVAISWDIEEVAALDSVMHDVTEQGAMFDGVSELTVLDALDTELSIVGRILKDGQVIGRAHIGGDGRAMVYVGDEGSQRVQFASAVDGEVLEARWSDDDAAAMIGWLLNPPTEEANVLEPTASEGGAPEPESLPSAVSPLTQALKDSDDEFRQKVADGIRSALIAMGWIPQEYVGSVKRTIGGGVISMMNPEGIRNFYAKVSGTKFVATFGDDVMASVDIVFDKTAEQLAKELDDNVTDMDPRSNPNEEVASAEPASQPASQASATADNDFTRLNALKAAAPKDAITSDDPNALEKLRAKLAYLTAYQEFMRKANKFVRSNNDAGLIEMGFLPKLIEKLKEPDFAGRKGFADYMLSNNNGVISTTRKRIEQMEAQEKARLAVQPQGGDISYRAVDDMFTAFYADTKAGEEAWKIINQSPDSEGGKVFTAHAQGVIEQLRAAGYTVTESKAPEVNDDELLKQLQEPVSSTQAQEAPQVQEVPPQDAGAAAGSSGLPDAAVEEDKAYLQSLINGTADMLDPGIYDKLEPLFTKYADDASMMDLLNKAAEAYTEAAVSAAKGV